MLVGDASAHKDAGTSCRKDSSGAQTAIFRVEAALGPHAISP
jgi:hypothetical protein